MTFETPEHMEPEYIPYSGPLAEDMVGADEPWVTLPYIWSQFGDDDGNGGPAVTDPLMLYIHVPAMGEVDDPNGPSWRVPFSALIDDMISGNVRFDTKMIDPKVIPVLTTVRDALQALTDKLSATLVENTSHANGI